jgi:LAO/AO transport system kinase
MRAPTASDLVERARAGDRGAVAKLISRVEQGGDEARSVVASLHAQAGNAQAGKAQVGNAWSIGITGAPGSGKSTLTDRLVSHLRAQGDTVGVLAVDPSSPFSGGAILGDRVRMQQHATDPGVFIRSMATRGHLGGLAVATPQAARVLDAIGTPWIIIETVGVGQVEVEIAGHSDTTVVVLNPGWGDAVQAAKAGLLEVADVFVVNKADRPGAADTVRDLEGMLELAGSAAWQPPIVCTTATTGAGTDELWQAIVRHRAHLETTGAVVERRRERLRAEIRTILAERLLERAAASARSDAFEAALDQVADGTRDPYDAADALLGDA